MSEEIRTNSSEFLSGIRVRLDLPLSYKVRSRIYSLIRRFVSMDEFEWSLYDIHYRAETAWNKRYLTEDLGKIDFKFIDGKIYILGDCKPLNPTCRCIYEAICNLPSIESLAEIGVGGGKLIANVRTILGSDLHYSAYDISEKQLLFFREQYPDMYWKTAIRVLDLTKDCISEAEKPDVVFASTVLLHIQRAEAYQRAVQNLLKSARRYVVLMDNWNAHDYFLDLGANTDRNKMFYYDSGANVAIVIDLKGEMLNLPYHPLLESSALGKYMENYRY